MGAQISEHKPFVCYIKTTMELLDHYELIRNIWRNECIAQGCIPVTDPDVQIMRNFVENSNSLATVRASGLVIDNLEEIYQTE